MRLDRLDLNLLVALNALIEERSVSAAAKRLCLTQPAMSGALNRLRAYFADELLTQFGRQMVLTPRAEELDGPIRDVLAEIRARITAPAGFDPQIARRTFSVAISDTAYTTLMAALLRRAATLAPGIGFDILPTGHETAERLARGTLDLFISLGLYLQPDHPRRALYQERHAVIAWSEGPWRAGIDRAGFIAADHAVTCFGNDRLPAFSDTHFAQLGIERRIALRVPTFSALPLAVIGSGRIATMHRRHADYCARLLPIIVHEPPIAVPLVTQEAQWHAARRNDQGLHWLIGLLAEEAARL